MVREMVEMFGRPCYDLVADAVNVFLDLDERDCLNGSYVRDAWRRHDPDQKLRAAVRSTHNGAHRRRYANRVA
jgi:hypothetical protein